MSPCWCGHLTAVQLLALGASWSLDAFFPPQIFPPWTLSSSHRQALYLFLFLAFEGKEPSLPHGEQKANKFKHGSQLAGTFIFWDPAQS